MKVALACLALASSAHPATGQPVEPAGVVEGGRGGRPRPEVPRAAERPPLLPATRQATVPPVEVLRPEHALQLTAAPRFLLHCALLR